MLARATLGALCSVSLACGVGAERSAIESSLSHPDVRATTFEATARALDDHPEWVDQFYAVARRHPRLMHRFVANDTRDLREKDLATDTGRLLARNPPSLYEIFVSTIDASRTEPDARAAIARAVAARHAMLASIITAFPPTLRVTMDSTIDDANEEPRARAALLQSMRERSSEIAGFVMNDRPTLAALVKAMVQAGGGDVKAFVKIVESLFEDHSKTASSDDLRHGLP